MMRQRPGAGAASWPVRVSGILLLAGTLAGCGGSTPVSPRPPTTTIPAAPSITFVGEDERPEESSILLSMTAASTDSFTLVLSANNVSDLYGYGLDIVYDPAIIAFDEFEAGTFFDGANITVTTQVAEPTAGRLVIGQSRVGAVPGVSGNGTLVILHFKTVSFGSSVLAIEDPAAFDSTGATLPVDFLGGTVTVPFTGR